jgi:Fe(II)/alpha-ketoglutarate-dependent arginine beta-hydroxylase
MQGAVLRSTLQLTDEEASEVTAAAARLRGSPYGEPSDVEAFILTSLAVMRALPLTVLQGLLELRSRRDHRGVVLIHGFVLDAGIPTPPDWTGVSAKARSDSEGILIGTMLLLGEPFAFGTQQGGRLVQNILPVKGMESSQTNAGSMVFLEWHVEDAFTPWRGDFVGLLCLRSSSDAYTAYASVEDLELPVSVREILFERRFVVVPDEAHVGLEAAEGKKVSVLYGGESRPYIRYDPLFMNPDADDSEAADALRVLGDEVARRAQLVKLEQGDLLIIDNHRVVHGRTPFTPRFDGTDRWLQRLSVQSDFREMQIASEWGSSSRTIDPLLAGPGAWR